MISTVLIELARTLPLVLGVLGAMTLARCARVTGDR
jgi:hypothetical protein